MAVPDFPSMFVPFLQITADGKEHPIKRISEAIADVMATSGGLPIAWAGRGLTSSMLD